MIGIFISCSPSQKAFLTNPEDNLIDKSLPSTTLKHKLYLVGDAGGLDNKKNKSNYVLKAVKKKVKKDTVKNSVVFLGDNIYEHGLSKAKNKHRKKQEKIIEAQLDLAKGTDANLYFIPGNHDWNNNKKGGLAAIKRQDKYIKEHRASKKRVHFYPHQGCGDPHVVKIDHDLVYVFIDSQWWVHNWASESEINKGCHLNLSLIHI